MHICTYEEGGAVSGVGGRPVHVVRTATEYKIVVTGLKLGYTRP